MDLVHDGEKTIAQEEEEEETEDRISKLADDIIHRILSFLDMKYAIQTSALSKRWKFIWTSMPDLNLNFHTFGDMRQFAKFVKNVLSHRNNRTQVCAVKFTFKGVATQFVVRSIIAYAYSHHVRKLTIICTGRMYNVFPKSVFRSHTLKHLTLRHEQNGHLRSYPKSAWDFPSLETLSLTTFEFSHGRDEANNLNLFSKCVNLKDLTLHRCHMFGLRIFYICAPQLLNLTFTGNDDFPKIFKVVAPKLKNFSASVITGSDSLWLSTEGLNFLEKVNLSSSWCFEKNMRSIPQLHKLFQKLRSAKFLILDARFIEALSLYIDEVSHEPCPFKKLKCLKIELASFSSFIGHRDRLAKKVPRVRKYLLKNSPDATFIIDLPQVPPMRVKRPIQTVQNDTMANKMAKLDVPTAPKPSPSDVARHISRHEVHIDATTKKMEILEAVMQLPETIPEEKSMLEAKLKMQEEVIAKQKEMFEAKIQMQDEVNEKQQAMFELKIRMQDEVIAKQKTMFVAQIQMQDKVIAEQKATFEARIEMQDNVIVEQKEKLQIQDAVIAKQKAMFEAKTKMVDAAKLQHEKLMSLIIKSKIAELKVKLDRGNLDQDVIHSTGIDLKSVMDLMPESLRVKLEARFSSIYEGFKTLFLTHIDDSQWAKIESELEKEYKGFLE